MSQTDASREITDRAVPVIDEHVDARMASLARMGKGLAVELVPLITVLNNIIQLAEVGLRNGDPARKAAIASLPTADRALDSATALVRRLEDFGSSASGPLEAVELGALMESSSSRLEKVVGVGVSIEIRGLEGELWVRIDAKRFEQVFNELAKNAADAMRGSGRLVIELHSGRDEATGEEFARVVFEDSGPGLDSESCRRAIEPFFTTKHRDLGIGLGLSIAYATVRTSGGRLSLSSDSPGGCRAQVDLPMTKYPSLD
ncbi:MAG: hypothetical protein GY895_01190 [Phycisphaera sp.]|nr:hypothetical protein [Phycisphaera sp.]